MLTERGCLFAPMEALESRRLLDADPSYLLTLGSREQDAGESVTADVNGNVLVAGTFERAINFDPAAVHILDSSGGNDAFIASYAPDQTLRWAHRIGGENFDSAKGIASDTAGNLYVVGEFQGKVNFDPGGQTSNLTSTRAGDGSFSQDVFILKLNKNGRFQWARRIGGRGFDEVRAVAVDGSGVYLAGSFARTVDFDPGKERVRRTAEGESDIFMLKLSKGGDYGYSRRLGGAGADVGMGLVVDEARRAYVTGQSSAADGNAFVARLDRNGGVDWFRRMGGSSLSTAGRDIAITKEGHVLTIGAFQGIADFDPSANEHYLTSRGFTDTFISRLDERGRFMWARQLGGTGVGGGEGIATDSRGAIFVTGTFTRKIDLDPGAKSLIRTSNGSEDVYVAKLNKNGRLLAGTSFGGERQDSVTSLSLGGTSTVYVSGFFKGRVDFDPGSGRSVRRSIGDFDLFVVGYEL